MHIKGGIKKKILLVLIHIAIFIYFILFLLWSIKERRAKGIRSTPVYYDWFLLELMGFFMHFVFNSEVLESSFH